MFVFLLYKDKNERTERKLVYFFHYVLSYIELDFIVNCFPARYEIKIDTR